MTIDFTCGKCGQKLRASEQNAGRQTTCPACNTVAIIPAAEPIPLLDAAIQTEVPAHAVPSTRITTAAGRAICPECKAALPPEAVLCIECGYDVRTGKQRKTKKRRLQRTFDRSAPLWGRILICVVALAIPIFVMISTHVFIWWLLALGLFFAAAFATPYGYRFRITVKRDRRGDLHLRKEHWFCFLSLSNWKINLKGYTEAITDYQATYTTNVRGHQEQQEHYILQITGPRKNTRLIYDGSDDDFMRDLADVLQYDAGMQVKRK